VLLAAIRLLQEANVDADYVLAGDGEVEEVRRLVATLPEPSRVTVPGWLTPEVVMTHLNETYAYAWSARRRRAVP
jgi:hypothetical protein